MIWEWTAQLQQVEMRLELYSDLDNGGFRKLGFYLQASQRRLVVNLLMCEPVKYLNKINYTNKALKVY
jgi:hypothetical protein